VNLERISNRKLVRRLVTAGPEDPAWHEFINRFQERIRLIAHRAFVTGVERNSGLDTGRASEFVEDLIQDVFVRLIDGDRRALSRFQGRSESSIFKYLHSIATNLVRDHFKKLRAQRSIPGPISLSAPLRTPDGRSEGLTLGDRVAGSVLNPEAAVESAELRRRIAAAVERASRGSASNRNRLIFRLFFVEGLTMDEITSIRAIGLSRSGVEKVIRKTRKAVQKILSEEDKEGGKAQQISSI